VRLGLLFKIPGRGETAATRATRPGPSTRGPGATPHTRGTRGQTRDRDTIGAGSRTVSCLESSPSRRSSSTSRSAASSYAAGKILRMMNSPRARRHCKRRAQEGVDVEEEAASDGEEVALAAAGLEALLGDQLEHAVVVVVLRVVGLLLLHPRLDSFHRSHAVVEAVAGVAAVAEEVAQAGLRLLHGVRDQDEVLVVLGLEPGLALGVDGGVLRDPPLLFCLCGVPCQLVFEAGVKLGLAGSGGGSASASSDQSGSKRPGSRRSLATSVRPQRARTDSTDWSQSRFWCGLPNSCWEGGHHLGLVRCCGLIGIMRSLRKKTSEGRCLALAGDDTFEVKY
jgi:hypothetical protein